MTRAQQEESASKMKHEKSATRKKCNMKIVQHDQSIETGQNLEKNTKEERTIVHYSAVS